MSETSGSPRSIEELSRAIAARLAEYERNPEHPDLRGHPEGNPVQIRPAFPSAEAWAERHASGVQNNATRYAEGVAAPRANFKELALKRKAAWANAVNEAVAGDRYAKGMAAVDAELAIELAKTVGQESFVRGVTARRAKIEAKMKSVAPAMAAAIATVRAMPADTVAQREARSIEMQRAFRAISKK